MSTLIAKIGGDLELIKNGFMFAWIIDYPMFEYEKGTKNLTSLHHPFTSQSQMLKILMIKHFHAHMI